MSATFADPTRIRRQALADAKSATGVFKAWWRNDGRPSDPRTFDELPVGAILYAFYSHSAEAMLRLESNKALEAEQHMQLRRLRDMFKERPEAPPASPLKRLDLSAVPHGEFFDDDPIFDSWVQAARTGKIPASWYSPALRDKLRREGKLK